MYLCIYIFIFTCTNCISFKTEGILVFNLNISQKPLCRWDSYLRPRQPLRAEFLPLEGKTCPSLTGQTADQGTQSKPQPAEKSLLLPLSDCHENKAAREQKRMENIKFGLGSLPGFLKIVQLPY